MFQRPVGLVYLVAFIEAEENFSSHLRRTVQQSCLEYSLNKFIVRIMRGVHGACHAALVFDLG